MKKNSVDSLMISSSVELNIENTDTYCYFQNSSDITIIEDSFPTSFVMKNHCCLTPIRRVEKFSGKQNEFSSNENIFYSKTRRILSKIFESSSGKFCLTFSREFQHEKKERTGKSASLLYLWNFIRTSSLDRCSETKLWILLNFSISDRWAQTVIEFRPKLKRCSTVINVIFCRKSVKTFWETWPKRAF